MKPCCPLSSVCLFSLFRHRNKESLFSSYQWIFLLRLKLLQQNHIQVKIWMPYFFFFFFFFTKKTRTEHSSHESNQPWVVGPGSASHWGPSAPSSPVQGHTSVLCRLWWLQSSTAHHRGGSRWLLGVRWQHFFSLDAPPPPPPPPPSLLSVPVIPQKSCTTTFPPRQEPACVGGKTTNMADVAVQPDGRSGGIVVMKRENKHTHTHTHTHNDGDKCCMAPEHSREKKFLTRVRTRRLGCCAFTQLHAPCRCVSGFFPSCRGHECLSGSLSADWFFVCFVDA